MKPALVDVAVLILFFNRPRQLAQVFEQVKKHARRVFSSIRTARAERKTCRALKPAGR